jgi:hypothetical protein
MKSNNSIKIVFLFQFIVIAMSISYSQKGIFLPAESAYTMKVRAILDTAHYFCDTAYPIKLIDKPPFEKAVYRDMKELISLMGSISLSFLSQHWTSRVPQEPMSNEEGKRGYFIISCDEEYIYSGILKESSSELYAKYDPTKEDNKDIYPVIKTKSYKKFYYWIVQEMNKGAVISIGGTQRTRIAKSFGVIQN